MAFRDELASCERPTLASPSVALLTARSRPWDRLEVGTYLRERYALLHGEFVIPPATFRLGLEVAVEEAANLIADDLSKFLFLPPSLLVPAQSGAYRLRMRPTHRCVPQVVHGSIFPCPPLTSQRVPRMLPRS